MDNLWIYVDSLEEKTYFLEGLEQYTMYLWTVRAHCSEEQTSDWAEQKSFYTGGWGINNLDKEKLTVYASGKMLNIINPKNRYIEVVQLFDITGKLLSEHRVNTTANVMIPTNLSSGEMVIFVRIIGNNEVESHKVLLF